MTIARGNLLPSLSGGVTQPIAVTATGPATPTAQRLNLDQLIFFWVVKSGAGTPAIDDDFNCSSITDTAVGQFTPNIATAFSNATYGGGHGQIIGTSAGRRLMMVSPATTSFQIDNRATSNDSLQDGGSDFHIILAGDN